MSLNIPVLTAFLKNHFLPYLLPTLLFVWRILNNEQAFHTLCSFDKRDLLESRFISGYEKVFHFQLFPLR